MRLSKCAALPGLCLALILQACSNMPAAPSATVDYDHSYDFSHVHKIAIQPITRDTVATMLISDQQIKRINGALTTELQRRSFQVVTENADADMFLSWKYISQDSGTLSPFNPSTPELIRGTLYVNMIDPVMLQSKWRSTFQAELRVQLESEEAAQFRRKAAQAILEQFPPGVTAP
jgi:hypothetical protein